MPTSSKNCRNSKRPRPLHAKVHMFSTTRRLSLQRLRSLCVHIIPGPHTARTIEQGPNGGIPLPPRCGIYPLNVESSIGIAEAIRFEGETDLLYDITFASEHMSEYATLDSLPSCSRLGSGRSLVPFRQESMKKTKLDSVTPLLSRANSTDLRDINPHSVRTVLECWGEEGQHGKVDGLSCCFSAVDRNEEAVVVIGSRIGRPQIEVDLRPACRCPPNLSRRLRENSASICP